jgi:hypothetical protein
MRIFLVCFIAAIVVGAGLWLFLGWVGSRAFESASGGSRQLFDVLEASMGATLSRTDSQMRVAPGGALNYYQQNPQELQRDRKYFETWHSALAIADTGSEKGLRSSIWESSLVAAWIPQSQRADSWGHGFCVRADLGEIIVVSPGPEAMSSLDCTTLKLSQEELSRMPNGKLSPVRSGALVLVLKKPGETAMIH